MAVRLMSAIAPASSTPVGPPPTTTKVRYARCLRDRFVFGALEGDEHSPSNLGRLLERLEPGRKLLPFGMSEITVPRSARKDQVVERKLVSSSKTVCRSRSTRRRARDESRRSAPA